MKLENGTFVAVRKIFIPQLMDRSGPAHIFKPGDPDGTSWRRKLGL